MNTGRHVLRTITLSVVVMHAAALVLIDTPTAKPQQQGAGGSRHRVVQTRLAQAPVATPAPAIKQPDEATQADPSSTSAVPTGPVDNAMRSPSEEGAETARTDNASADNLDVAATEASPPEPPIADSGDSYLPRPMLTTAPQPSTPVLMPFPEQVTEPGRYATILALFIDEDGVVRRVRVDGPALPKSMEDTAREAFLRTHFRPGEVEGQQVKSLIRIEVVFDNTPTTTRQASRSL